MKKNDVKLPVRSTVEPQNDVNQGANKQNFGT